MTRPADWRQREQARDPDHSWIVQAPAGSGKTELLTQRMLGLLARVEHPEEVIAITFTRKAAAEMNHRLIGHLRAAATESGDGLEPHQQVSRELALAALRNDRDRGWNLLDQPSRLRIRTIDSLCSDLARQLPILSGLGGGQQIAENPDPLYRQAAARTMAAIEDDRDELQADITRVLDRYDNQYDRLVDLLAGMLSNREQWISHLLAIRTEDGFDRAALEQSLARLVEAELQSLSALEQEQELISRLLPYIEYAASNLADEVSGPLRLLLDACKAADAGLPATAASLPHWITLARFLLTADGAWRRRITRAEGFPALEKTTGEERARRRDMKAGFAGILESLQDQGELLERLNIVRLLPRPDYEDESWESLASLIRILIRASQEWNVVIAESGLADYSEIASRAIQALGDEGRPSNLALRLDYRIGHLLVDEFQDTSLSQIRLLQRLTSGWTPGDGHTLFLVGDPMQSIYRFRKAEVSLFIQAFEGRLFQHTALRPLQLQVNFRSSLPIVDWVNEVFPKVMPGASDPLDDAVHYSHSSPRPGAVSTGRVRTWLWAGRDDDAEAQRVVDIIRQSNPEQTVAILVRSRKHASAILARLDRLKAGNSRYRYQAIDFNPLAETPAIQDLAALTLALVQVADRLAWLAVLRSPFIGLDLSDLDALASADSRRVIADVLAQFLQSGSEAFPSLTGTGRQRLARVAPILLDALEMRGGVSTRTLVESTWIRLGGPACVESTNELDDAASYLELLDTLEDEGLPVDRDSLGLRMDKLFAQPDSAASGRLQVMTIYSAKGLQFDTVIVPGLNRATGNNRGQLLHWFELAGQKRIVMSPMRNAQERERRKREGDLIQFIADVEKRRQALENGRLLYVAATRARYQLFLSGAIEATAGGEIRPINGTLLAELWPAIEQQQLPALQEAAREADGAVDAQNPDSPPPENPPEVQDQPYRRLAPDWRLPPPPPSLQLAEQDPVEVSEDIEFSWAGEDARLAGDLVHRLLQLIAGQGMARWSDSGGMAARESWCRQHLASHGVTADKADRILLRTSQAVANCLSSERGQWILADRDEAESELAISAMLDGRVSKLKLDRTFVEAGERWIIDYKTSHHGGGGLQDFLDSEMDRYRSQLERYRQAIGLNESRPIHIALYFPLLDEFREL